MHGIRPGPWFCGDDTTNRVFVDVSGMQTAVASVPLPSFPGTVIGIFDAASGQLLPTSNLQIGSAAAVVTSSPTEVCGSIHVRKWIAFSVDKRGKHLTKIWGIPDGFFCA